MAAGWLDGPLGSPLGFGTYRLTAEHERALATALDVGCTLIDTAATYTGGQAERIVGQVLRGRPDDEVFVITKAGYLHEGEDWPETIQLRDGQSRYSIHPNLLAGRIRQSLARLGRGDFGFLLHNPEDLFDDPLIAVAEYESRVTEAFAFLEGEVAAGHIGCYGMSSNLLPLARCPVRLPRLLELASNVSRDHHFCIVQFPYNLGERDAARRHGGHSLLEEAAAAGLTTVGNRPLNVRVPDGTVRLTEIVDGPDDAGTERLRAEFTAMMDEGLAAAGTRFRDLPVATVIDNPHLLRTTEAVDFVYGSIIEPLVARLGSPARLTEVAGALRAAMDAEARRAQTRAAAGLLAELPGWPGTPAPVAACASYLRDGLDHVLVGMRRPEYVRQLAPLFAARQVQTGWSAAV